MVMVDLRGVIRGSDVLERSALTTPLSCFVTSSMPESSFAIATEISSFAGGNAPGRVGGLERAAAVGG